MFSSKTKGFFVELNDYGCLFARTSGREGAMVVRDLEECPPGDVALFSQTLDRLMPKKAPSGYVHAVCGLYPNKRLIRRVTIDPKKAREDSYFAEVLSQQCRVEPSEYSVAVINAADGGDFDSGKASQKDVLFCGLPKADVDKIQDGLLENGVYPERVELASLGMLGGLVDYLLFRKSKTPVLVLEIGADATHSFIISGAGVEATRPIPQGLDSMIPVVQKELNLKDEESARKMFFSNTFDFTGMGPLLVKRLVKELQSSIGFYEVQTGQSVGQVYCSTLPPALSWMNATLASGLGVPTLEPDLAPWLEFRGITLSEQAAAKGKARHWFGLYSLMANYQSAGTATNEVPAEKKD